VSGLPRLSDDVVGCSSCKQMGNESQQPHPVQYRPWQCIDKAMTRCGAMHSTTQHSCQHRKCIAQSVTLPHSHVHWESCADIAAPCSCCRCCCCCSDFSADAAESRLKAMLSWRDTNRCALQSLEQFETLLFGKIREEQAHNAVGRLVRTRFGRAARCACRADLVTV
jgi:hypothetical protein